MKRRPSIVTRVSAALVLVAALLTAGCESPPASQQSPTEAAWGNPFRIDEAPPQQETAPPPAEKTQRPPAAEREAKQPPAAERGAKQPAPEPPAGGGLAALFKPAVADEDAWAIRCITLRGPRRIETAGGFERLLKNVRELKSDQVTVLHRDEESIVYYGRYARQYDTKTGRESYRPDPNRELEYIRSLSMDAPSQFGGTEPVWPFRMASMEALPAPERERPEWDLNRVREGYWSIHVGVFYNEGEMRRRRFAAMEYCKLLREQGEDAYYHHGTERSSVYVGIFPKDAIQRTPVQDPLTGRLTYVNKIVDEKMLAVQQRFPHSLQNGHLIHEIRRSPGTNAVSERVASPSFPVKIPSAERREQGVLDFDVNSR